MKDRYNGWAIEGRLYFTTVGYLMGFTCMRILNGWGEAGPVQHFFVGVVAVAFVGIFVFAHIQDGWAKRTAERERR